MDDFKKEIGSRLSNIRKNKGLSQKDFSDIMGFSNQQYVSQIEKGVKKPSIESLINLTETLKVDLNWLLTGKPCEAENYLKFIFQRYLEQIKKQLEDLKEIRRKEIAERKQYILESYYEDGAGVLHNSPDYSSVDDEISNLECLNNLLIDKVNTVIHSQGNKIQNLTPDEDMKNL